MFSHIGSTRAFNQNFLTFNSLNSFILKGDGAQGMELTFASLMASRTRRAGLPCTGSPRAPCRYPPDGLTYRFLMRPGVKFHDGSPLTAHDVAFSLKILKEKGHPIAQQLLRDFAGAEATDDATVVVRFAPQARRATCRCSWRRCRSSRAPIIRAAPFDETTLDVPLGCGPYKVGRFEAGRYIEYERVKDWWGADLPVSRGQNNFDIVRYEYLSRPRRRLRRLHRQELSVPRGIHLAHLGDALRLSGDPRRPRQARHHPRRNAVGRARLVLQHPSRQVQGQAPARGADLRLRFRMDQQDHHVRVLSADPFGVPEFRHDGDRQARGRTSSRCSSRSAARFADEVFGEPFVPPVSDGSGQDRALLRKASALLQEAGFVVKDGKRVTPQGERDQRRVPARRAVVPAASHAVHQESRRCSASRPICAWSIRCSFASASTISISISRCSGSAFRARPGDSLRSYFSSQAAAMKGSQNLAGIADPVDRCADRQDHRGRQPAEPGDRLQGARPGDPHRPLLDSALVQGARTGSPIGTCSAGPRQNRAMRAASRRPGGTIARRPPSSSSG